MEEALAGAVAQHITERGRLLNPAEARDRCQSESVAFMETLAGFGIEATVVSGFRMAENVILCGHFAVRVGDDVWDWTARQFDPTAAVPLVIPWEEWCELWSNPTEGWFDPLDDPVSVLFEMADRLGAEDGK